MGVMAMPRKKTEMEISLGGGMWLFYIVLTCLIIALITLLILDITYGPENLGGGVGGSIFAYAVIIVGIILTLRPYFPIKKIYLTEDGIKTSYSKQFPIIKYEWIEKVILNCRITGDPPDVIVLFKKDGKEYFYFDFQRRITDYKEFVEGLRRRNIKVEIWEKSLFLQQDKYTDWLREELRRRIIVR